MTIGLSKEQRAQMDAKVADPEAFNRFNGRGSPEPGTEPPPPVPPDTGKKPRNTTMVNGNKRLVTTIDEMNEKFAYLCAPHTKTAFVLRKEGTPVLKSEIQDRVANAVIRVQIKQMNEETGKLETKTIPFGAFKTWYENADRFTYTATAFTNKPVGPHVYNVFKGLGVAPAEGDCDLILQHAREVICGGDPDVFNDWVRYEAWKLQNIGEPSRIVAIIRSIQQQIGKGVFYDGGGLFSRIYGPSHFTVLSAEQVLGRFNDALLGRTSIVFDEALFAGDRQAWNRIKSMSTARSIAIESKNIAVVTVPGAVNFVGITNEAIPTYIDQNDERVWLIDASDCHKNDRDYFARLVYQIEHGGAEAFADYLLTLDLGDFRPFNDIDRRTNAKKQLVVDGLNPYDARVWLRACCEAETIIGMPYKSGVRNEDEENRQSNVAVFDSASGYPWIEGDKVLFADLAAAYAKWQQSVKTRRAPEPTKPGALGGILRTAGFGEGKRQRISGRRSNVLPAIEECLATLDDWPDDQTCCQAA